MVTDTAMFRYAHYHTPQDTIDKIEFERMARVVRGLEKAVAELSSPAPKKGASKKESPKKLAPKKQKSTSKNHTPPRD